MKKQLPNLIALVAVFLSLWFNWLWIWGFLFLFWTIQSLRTGEAFLVQPALRKENPALFWVIVLTWLGLSLLVIATDLFNLSGTFS